MACRARARPLTAVGLGENWGDFLSDCALGSEVRLKDPRDPLGDWRAFRVCARSGRMADPHVGSPSEPEFGEHFNESHDGVASAAGSTTQPSTHGLSGSSHDTMQGQTHGQPRNDMILI